MIAGNLHTQLEPLPADVPMGAQLACQRPGPCSIDCVYGLGRFYNLGCPRTRSCRWAWPGTTRTGTPLRPVADLAYLPGISVEEITSPPLMLAVFDANTTT